MTQPTDHEHHRTVNYLRTYFSERDLPDRIIQVEVDGVMHMIASDEIIRMVLEVARPSEQMQVASTIRKIEWNCPDSIHGFIDHLAMCFAQTQMDA